MNASVRRALKLFHREWVWFEREKWDSKDFFTIETGLRIAVWTIFDAFIRSKLVFFSQLCQDQQFQAILTVV